MSLSVGGMRKLKTFVDVSWLQLMVDRWLAWSIDGAKIARIESNHSKTGLTGLISIARLITYA